MFPVSSLDALADGQSAGLFYIPVPNGGPDGIEVAPDGAIHFNTVGGLVGLKDPAGGGMYRLTKEDFKSGHLPAPSAQGLGALDGLDFAGSVRLDTETKNTKMFLKLKSTPREFTARKGFCIQNPALTPYSRVCPAFLEQLPAVSVGFGSGATGARATEAWSAVQELALGVDERPGQWRPRDKLIHRKDRTRKAGLDEAEPFDRTLR
jgi:hypothetical protein